MQELILILTLITIFIATMLILISLLNELLGGVLPCKADDIIEDILTHHGYVNGYRKEKMREMLKYEYKYHSCDRYSRLIKRFKELEKEILF